MAQTLTKAEYLFDSDLGMVKPNTITFTSGMDIR